MKIFLLIFFCFSTVRAVVPPPGLSCSQNETFVECKNPCPQLCESIMRTGPEIACAAPFPCPSGCDCITGYVRDANNICIDKTDCPYYQCGGDLNAQSLSCGDPCPITCENMMDNGPQICPQICIINGCACKPGFVQNSEGKCILPGECPNYQCNGDLNAQSLSCGDPCPITCEKMMENGPQICPEICIINGCACKPGFVQNSEGKCILPEECPPQPCPPNEVYVPCPGYCTFDEDCGSYVEGFIRDCAAPPEPPLPCAPTCRCKPGFVKINGNCVLPSECCPSPSTLLVDCPAPCDRNCTYSPKPDCQQFCSLRKCICAPKYVRIGETCVPENTCPCSDPNAVFQKSLETQHLDQKTIAKTPKATTYLPNI